MTVHLVRYSGPFLKMTHEKQIDPKTRKLMTIHKTLQPRNDIDRLYVTRGLTNNEDCLHATIQWFDECAKKKKKD